MSEQNNDMVDGVVGGLINDEVDDYTTRLTLMVPNELTASIVGKRGSNVNRLQVNSYQTFFFAYLSHSSCSSAGTNWSEN